MTGRSDAVCVSGLTKDFGATRALDGISFRVLPGEIFALLGPNGAGKPVTGLWHLLLQVEKRAQDAPDGGQLTGSNGAETVVEALVRYRARVLRPGEGGKFAQARRLRGDRNLMPQSPVPACDRYHEYHRMRQRQVQRAGNDDDRAAASLFRSDDGAQVCEPDVAGPQRLTHSSPSPSPAV